MTKLTKTLFTHFLCHVLVLVPFALTQQALASEAQQTQSTQDTQAQLSQKQREENIKHEALVSQEGLITKCDVKKHDTIASYLDREQHMQTFIDQGLSKIKKRKDQLNILKGHLQTAEGLQQESDPAKRKEIDELAKKMQAAKVDMDKKKLILDQTPGKGDDDSDHSEPYRQALNAYIAARNIYYSLRSQVAGKEAQMNAIVQNTTNQQDNQALSHALSGCMESGSSKTCQLSGPLFEKDAQLTKMANENIHHAVQLAKVQSEALLDLELEKQFNGDYKLFESAILMGDDGHNLSQFDQMGEDNPLKTRNISMMISNIKTLGLASAGVKDLTCQKVPESEADSKSYHLFKAAAATYLMAQINDTGLYSNSSSCRSTEDYTSDDKNLQIRTVERAANLTQEQLENVCLRINPTPPQGSYDWKMYGDSPEHAEQRIEGLKSLKVQCNGYLEELRGPEYVNKPRTREAALEMMTTALSLAVEELAAKREKVATAYANVKKGEAWVKRVQTYIATMIAMAIALKLASRFFFSLPFCKGCAKGSSLLKKSMYITAIVVGIYLMSELARAKSFLNQWKKKLEIAKSFTHLDCNYQQAHGEEKQIHAMAQTAKDSMLQEVQRVKNQTILEINSSLYVPAVITPTSESPATSFIDYLVELIPAVQADTTEAAVRDPQRLARSLGVAYGSESFRFFLVQKIEHWKTQANDIVKDKNYELKSIVTLDDLVEPFLNGTGTDPLEKVKPEHRVGFPTPETRVVTIQNAIALMTDNIGRLNGVIGDVSFQKETYVNLLKEMRARLKIKSTGLSNNDQLSAPDVQATPMCLTTAGALDKNCSCQNNGGCSSFQIASLGSSYPATLATSTKNSLSYANSVLSGDLAKANIAAGSMNTGDNTASNLLEKSLEKLNEQRKKSGFTNNRDLSSDSQQVLNGLENNANKAMTSSSLTNRYENSPLAYARNSLLNGNNTGLTGAQSKNKKGAGTDGQQTKINLSEKALGTSSANGRHNQQLTDSFQLTDEGDDSSFSNGNQENSESLAASDQAANKAYLNSRYHHKRNTQDDESNKSGITYDRHKTLFSIISKRYEKTAYPTLLFGP